MWAEGGYVFVGRQDASGVAQALAENGIEYLICSIANTHEHGLLWPLSHVLDAKHVIVYVDDESLTFSKRTDHYRRFLSKVIDQCRKWDDEPVSSSWRFLPVFYIDINLPSISSFAHRMAQASKQFGTFELSSKNAFDREVDQGMAFGREPEELKTLMASSVCIYGAGKRNSAEIVSAHRLSAMQPAPEDEYRWIQTLGDLRQESNLAWVGHQTEPKVVDLSL
jgi:hypothetical protein